MDKNKKIFLILAFLIVSLIIFFPVRHFIEETGWLNNGNPIREVIIRGNQYKLDEVKSANKMAKGLGGRESLCPQCGMLFVFPTAARHSFWMKDMLFPLDIIWIKGDEIVHIEKNISPQKKEIMNPDVLSDKVIELAGGTADKDGITVGCLVEFKKNDYFPIQKMFEWIKGN